MVRKVMIRSEPSVCESVDRKLLTARYLFIIPGSINRLTGGSIYNKRLVEHLSGSGSRVDVVSLPDLPYFAGLFISPIIAAWLMLKLARKQYDRIIEDGWSHPALALFNLARVARNESKLVIIVHQVRCVERSAIAAPLASIIERAALSSASLIITVSRFMRGEIASLLGDASKLGNVSKIIIAPPGSDYSVESRARIETSTASGSHLEGAAARLLFVGNCMRRKGIHHLIRAIAIAGDSSIQLDVIGDCAFEPGYVKQLRREVARLGLERAVTFHGRVSDETLARFYERADIFVMPSLYEGFGIVYAEAMSAGLPIIATNTGPVPEIVRAGENALLVEPADPESLAGAIRVLAADAHMRKLFGRRSRELASRLITWRETCEKVRESLLSAGEEAAAQF